MSYLFLLLLWMLILLNSGVQWLQANDEEPGKDSPVTPMNAALSVISLLQIEMELFKKSSLRIYALNVYRAFIIFFFL